MTTRLFAIIFLLAFFIGGLSSIVFDRLFIPYLATLPHLEGLKNLTTDSPIVINHRQEFQIDQNVNFVDLAKQAGSFTVSVFTGTAPSLTFSGNGIILTSDGVIFTTKQVVGSNSTVTVVLNDGRNFPGLVRAMDPNSDLAVLTIPANGLSVAQFDDPWNLQVGQRLFALGKSSAELSRVFETGTVNATISQNASMTTIYSTTQLTEHFTAMPNLSSDFVGGPVLDIEGKVVSLYSGVGTKFISSEGLNQALKSYLATNKITRAYWGIQYLDLSKPLAALRGLSQPGVMVVTLSADSPAAKAGLAVGDYIIAVDGTLLSDNSFERLTNRKSPGSAKLTVSRAGQNIEITFNVENR